VKLYQGPNGFENYSTLQKIHQPSHKILMKFVMMEKFNILRKRFNQIEPQENSG